MVAVMRIDRTRHECLQLIYLAKYIVAKTFVDFRPVPLSGEGLLRRGKAGKHERLALHVKQAAYP